MSDDYEAPLHFAFANHSSLATDEDCRFWVEAARLQLVNHVCPVWGLMPPGAALYPVDATFPSHTALACLFVDDDGDDLAAGLHGAIGGMPYVLIDVHQSERPSVVVSHELIETTVNQYLGRWADVPPLAYALEPADPVQGHTYEVFVGIMGTSRFVPVSNFVFPSWFDPASRSGWFDYLSILRSPLEIAEGGYAIAERDGRIVFLSARDAPVELPARAWHKWSRPARLVGRKKSTSG